MIEIIRDIYSAKLTFKRNLGVVVVEIRPVKNGEAKKKRLPIPEEIDQRELNWIRYRKEIISIYHRKINGDNYEYRDPKHIIAPTSLSQRLEQLVSNVCSNLYINQK
ncbi:MAG: hypothetical protein AABY15_09620 [Nanoarchaeota archaeon]